MAKILNHQKSNKHGQRSKTKKLTEILAQNQKKTRTKNNDEVLKSVLLV